MAFLKTGGGISSGPRRSESCDTAHSHSPALLKTPFGNCTWLFYSKFKKKISIDFFTALNCSAAWDTAGTVSKAKKSLSQLLHSLSIAPSRLSTHQEVTLTVSNDLCRWRKRRVCFQNQDVIIRGHMESIMTFHNINSLTCWLHNIQLLLLENWFFPCLSLEGCDLLMAETQYSFHSQPSPQNVGQTTAGPIISWEQNIRYFSPFFGSYIICRKTTYLLLNVTCYFSPRRLYK